MSFGNTSQILHQVNNSLLLLKWNDYEQESGVLLKQELLHIEKLIQQLGFRLEKNKQKTYLDELILPDMTQKLIDIFRFVYPNHSIEVNISSKILPIKTESFYFEELFRILLDNALKHTPKKGKVFIDIYSGKDGVIVSLKNTGVGMDEDSQRKLWRSEYRFEDRPKGHGFGLCIAREIAKKLKIKLLCMSELESFTQFTLSIPLS